MDRAERYFHEVAVTGSLRKASERLHVATSAISRIIQLLEESVGLDLFERVPQGMVLTEAGQLYLEYTHQLMHEEERIRSRLDALRGLSKGHVRIIAVEGLVGDFVVRTLQAFRRQYPGVTAEVRVDGSHTVQKALREREADIGISISGRADPAIDIVLRVDDPLLAVMAPTHELAGRRSLRIQELVEAYPFALPGGNFGIRSKVEEYMDLRKVEPVLVANSIAALRAFALHGNGITFLPFLAIREYIRRKELVGIKLANTNLLHMTIDIAIARDRRLPLPAQKLLEMLCDFARELRPGALAADPGQDG